MDLHYLMELYRRGESAFFSEVLRQFPAIYEEILACREMLAQVALNVCETRKLQFAAFGKEKHIKFLTNQREKLLKEFDRKKDEERPIYVQVSQDGTPFMTPAAKALAKRQAELIAARLSQ